MIFLNQARYQLPIQGIVFGRLAAYLMRANYDYADAILVGGSRTLYDGSSSLCSLLSVGRSSRR